MATSHGIGQQRRHTFNIQEWPCLSIWRQIFPRCDNKIVEWWPHRRQFFVLSFSALCVISMMFHLRDYHFFTLFLCVCNRGNSTALIHKVRQAQAHGSTPCARAWSAWLVLRSKWQVNRWMLKKGIAYTHGCRRPLNRRQLRDVCVCAFFSYFAMPHIILWMHSVRLQTTIREKYKDDNDDNDRRTDGRFVWRHVAQVRINIEQMKGLLSSRLRK